MAFRVRSLERARQEGATAAHATDEQSDDRGEWLRSLGYIPDRFREHLTNALKWDDPIEVAADYVEGVMELLTRRAAKGKRVSYTDGFVVVTEPDQTDGGYTAYSWDTPGVVSNGPTRRDAARHYLDALKASGADDDVIAQATRTVEACDGIS